MLFLLLSAKVFAYTMDSSFKPINEPFGLETENIKTGEDSASFTILVLQIFSGALLYFAAPIAVIMIIVAGMTMIFSAETPDAVGKSKKALVWTIFGLLLIILSYSIVKIIIQAVIDVGNV